MDQVLCNVPLTEPFVVNFTDLFNRVCEEALMLTFKQRMLLTHLKAMAHKSEAVMSNEDKFKSKKDCLSEAETRDQYQ